MWFRESLKMGLFLDKSAGHDIDPVPTLNINAGNLYNEGERKDTGGWGSGWGCKPNHTHHVQIL